jgi:hypothetical protein
MNPKCKQCGSIGAKDGQWFCWVCDRPIADDERYVDTCLGCEEQREIIADGMCARCLKDYDPDYGCGSVADCGRAASYATGYCRSHEIELGIPGPYHLSPEVAAQARAIALRQLDAR